MCCHGNEKKLTLQHVLVGIVRDGEQMGRHFNLPLSSVFLNDGVLINRQATVWVDSDAEKSRVGLKKRKFRL